MGFIDDIIDKIKGMLGQSTTGKGSDDSMKLFKSEGQRGNFNGASIHAFYALQNLGEVHVDVRREQHQTAREYGKMLSDEGYVTQEEIEPIIVNFEIAKYSELQVAESEYSKVSETLDIVSRKLKSGKTDVPKSSRRSGGGARKKPRRRRPTKGGKTGAARRRRRGSSDDE